MVSFYDLFLKKKNKIPNFNFHSFQEKSKIIKSNITDHGVERTDFDFDFDSACWAWLCELLNIWIFLFFLIVAYWWFAC